jgi:hypothetical protein
MGSTQLRGIRHAGRGHVGDELLRRVGVGGDRLRREVACAQGAHPGRHEPFEVSCQLLQGFGGHGARSSAHSALYAHLWGLSQAKPLVEGQMWGRLDSNQRPAACKPANPQRHAHQRKHCSAASETAQLSGHSPLPRGPRCAHGSECARARHRTRLVANLNHLARHHLITTGEVAKRSRVYVADDDSRDIELAAGDRVRLGRNDSRPQITLSAGYVDAAMGPLRTRVRAAPATTACSPPRPPPPPSAPRVTLSRGRHSNRIYAAASSGWEEAIGTSRTHTPRPPAATRLDPPRPRRAAGRTRPARHALAIGGNLDPPTRAAPLHP